VLVSVITRQSGPATARLRQTAGVPPPPPQFPRASAYDPDWVAENQMGPNALWLLEALCHHLVLEPGMRVLDLGCGKAMTSVFLAREFDVQVVAHDWWIPATDNWRRIVEAGQGPRVLPVHAEAHALPFADGCFDAVVSVDAYHYFGTDDLYVERMARLLVPGGQLGVVVPGLRHEPERVPPPGLAEWWSWDLASFHSPDWWRRLWERSGMVEVTAAEWLPDGHRLWLEWAELMDDWAEAHGRRRYGRDAALLRADADELLGFAILTARPVDPGPPRSS
jgi:cyclopropane fatty-acyl-phospholipid synthase-like methyltransferase